MRKPQDKSTRTVTAPASKKPDQHLNVVLEDIARRLEAIEDGQQRVLHQLEGNEPIDSEEFTLAEGVNQCAEDTVRLQARLKEDLAPLVQDTLNIVEELRRELVSKPTLQNIDSNVQCVLMKLEGHEVSEAGDRWDFTADEVDRILRYARFCVDAGRLVVTPTPEQLSSPFPDADALEGYLRPGEAWDLEQQVTGFTRAHWTEDGPECIYLFTPDEARAHLQAAYEGWQARHGRTVSQPAEQPAAPARAQRYSVSVLGELYPPATRTPEGVPVSVADWMDRVQKGCSLLSWALWMLHTRATETPSAVLNEVLAEAESRLSDIGDYPEHLCAWLGEPYRITEDAHG